MACALWIQGSKGPEAVPLEALPGLVATGRGFWLDLERGDLAEIQPYRPHLPGHTLNWEDAARPDHRPKLEDHGDHLFLVMRGLDTSRQRLADQLHTVQLACFLGERCLVTIRSGPLSSVDLAREQLVQGRLSREKSMEEAVDALLHLVLDDMVDRYGPHVEAWEQEMERLLREAMDRPRQGVMAKVLAVRKHMANLRRLALGQREILAQLVRREGLISSSQRPYFQDIHDHLTHLVEASESLRDTVNISVDVYLNSVNNRLSEVMKILTVMSSVMLPLTLLTGIYGMNFEHMPGLRHPYGFWGLLVFMALVVGGMLLYFKRSRWL